LEIEDLISEIREPLEDSGSSRTPATFPIDHLIDGVERAIPGCGVDRHRKGV